MYLIKPGSDPTGAEMRYCPYCGAKLVVNALFCHICGKKVPVLDVYQTPDGAHTVPLSFFMKSGGSSPRTVPESTEALKNAALVFFSGRQNILWNSLGSPEQDAVAAFMRIKLYLDSFTYAHCNLGDEKTFVESGKIQYWYRSYTEHCYDGGNCDKCTYIDGYVITLVSDKYVDGFVAGSNFEELKKSKKESGLWFYEYAGKLPYDDFPVAEANSAAVLVLIHPFGMNCSLKIEHLETAY